MDLKQELTDYEIGGIGGIKKHTLRRVTKTLYGRVGAACANAPA